MATQITYDNLNMELVVWYNGTVSAFESEVYTKDTSGKPTSLNQNSSKLKEYADKVILITGSTETNPDTAGKAQAIFISKTNANGTIEGKLMKLSDIPGYIAGINVGGTDYEADGNVILKLVGLNGISITVNPAGTVNFDANELKLGIGGALTAAQAADAKAAKALEDIEALKGDGDGTITDIVNNAIAGVVGEDNDDANDVTIKGVKNTMSATNDILFGKPLPLTTDKIKASALPDVIVGQLKFGGTIGNTQTTINNQQLQITPSADLDGFFDNISSQPFAFTPTAKNAKDYKGWYFIVAKPAGGGIGNFEREVTVDLEKVKEVYEIGDWLLSTGIDWVKIDNTDAVVSVAGRQGVITTKDLVDTLSTLNAQTNTDPLAKKSEILLKGVKVADASKEYITVNRDATTKEATISVDTASMQDAIGELIQGNDALATANDVFNFIKARLSIRKV